MNKTTLALLGLAMLTLAPVASAEVNAGFIGTTQCNSSTQICSYALGGIHWTDVIDVPDVGIGTFYLAGLTWGTCTFATGVSCITSGTSETLLAGQCGFPLEVTSESLLLGGYASASRTVCNPY